MPTNEGSRDAYGAGKDELHYVVAATLVAIVQNKGVHLESRTLDAGRREWKSIQTSAKVVDSLQG